jgi:hypothetical protein
MQHKACEMTLGAQIPALGLLIAVSACSIQRDVPGFTYPPTTLSGAAAEQPVLQPTENLIVDASADEQTYKDTIAQMDARVYRLRLTATTPADP